MATVIICMTANVSAQIEYCSSDDSGFRVLYLGKVTRDEGYCYYYWISRSSSLWDCDDESAQAWNFMLLDPCTNQTSNKTNDLVKTLKTLNTALTSFNDTQGAVYVCVSLLYFYCILYVFF